ncbi:uncharacterized protein KQ657_000762 [Scheffersomyces spartinae]|uniref:Uncharacterized protein n=1 Tax=Scheffersomyces spartinae TaxID=45513 RepID=A0A9P7V8F6_9ASCO|nr:uncharacterized protein KQ657_000762 [Scheffersomyces spartinae]KAG7193345.1 hypothetical protein KQ657_000762 [Scheffersomyces spartinae]
MRPAVMLLKHVPLIKFVGGPHLAPAGISHSVKAHPCAPEGLVPAAASAASAIVSSIFKGSLEPKDGEYFSRSELPARFRYTPPTELEMEDIISGGAEVVF